MPAIPLIWEAASGRIKNRRRIMQFKARLDIKVRRIQLSQ
jgi:hypothetical protein